MKVIKTVAICLTFALAFAVLAGAQAPTSALNGSVVLKGPMHYEHTLAPGGAAKGSFTLQNPTTRPQTVKLYQTDMLSMAGGKVAYGPVNSTPRSNSQWIVITPQQLNLAPGQSATVYYLIQLPNDVALAGSYYSMIMVEPLRVSDLAPVAPIAGQGQFSFDARTRYGIAITTNIGETGARGMRYTDRRVLTTAQGSVLQVEMENTGERRLGLHIYADVYDEQGVAAGHIELERDVAIQPGCVRSASIPLANLRPGKYSALVVADNGDEYVYGARYDLEIK